VKWPKLSHVPRLHIELPDDLHTRAKIAAAVRRSTLKALVIEALERIVSETEAEQAKGTKR
jgi:predicted transcriptional regulator